MKLNLQSKFSKGFWKDRKVAEVIDSEYYKFKGHYNKWASMYDEDVFEYMIEVEQSLKKGKHRAYLSRRDMRRTINMPNT